MNVVILMRLLTLFRDMVSSALPLSLCRHVQQAVPSGAAAGLVTVIPG